MDVINAESAAYYRNDLDGMSFHWLQTEQARRLWSGPQTGTIIHVGWEAVHAGYSQAMVQRPSNFDSREFLDRRNVQICVSREMAWVYYDQGLKRNDPKFYTQTDQKELKILHKIDDAWKIACMVIIAPALMREDVAQIRLFKDGTISRMSEAAKSVLADYEGLIVRGRKVHAAKAGRDPALQADIEDKLKRMATGLPPSAKNIDLRPVALGTDYFSRPLYCWVFVEGDELVIAFDVARNLSERIEDAAKTFGLSPTQKLVAEMLINGNDIQSVAQTMDVSVNTVKTHLRRMFEKTGTHDQPGLLSLLLTVDRPVHGPPRMA